MKQEIKTQELLKVVDKLKKAGFDVYAPENITTYCNFVKDDKIGYLERSDYGFNLSSVHKPNQKCGTGYSIHKEIVEPTIQDAEDCFCFMPRWASQHDCEYIKKYKGWYEYMNSPINNITEKVKI